MSDVIPLERHLRRLRKNDRQYIEQRFTDLQRAIDVAAGQLERRNVELNDVRLRFIPREVYEADQKAYHRSTDEYRARQEAKMRNALVFIFAEAVAIIALGLTLVAIVLRNLQV